MRFAKIKMKTHCPACKAVQEDTITDRRELEEMKRNPQNFVLMCQKCGNLFSPVVNATFTEVGT